MSNRWGVDSGGAVWRRGWRWSLVPAAVLAIVLMASELVPQLEQATALVRQNKGAALPLAKSAVDLGSWTAPQNIGVVGIHAALLYSSGNVLFWYGDHNKNTGSLGAVWNPSTGAVTTDNLPFPYNIFCSGSSLLPNGQLLVAGGHDDTKSGHADAGIWQSTLFNPPTNAWSQAANMNYARWYPTNIELANGTTLVASGDDANEQLVLPMEEYNYQTNWWTVLPASANFPSDGFIYPRMVLLTNGNVFMGGMSAGTMTFNTATNAWSTVGNLQFGQRIYGAMVLLPGLDRVLEVGGNTLTNQTADATNTAEMINFSDPKPAWAYVASMNYPRQNENLVLLPDGTVLAVGGGEGGGTLGESGGRYVNPVYEPEIYNPKLNTWTVMNPQQAQRTYHSTALLLPDGRVVSAGSDYGSLEETVEVFSPPYLSRAPRPTITSAPASLTYGQGFTITTPDAANIIRVALIKVASTTHATRFDERFVDLTFSLGDGQITATAPPSGAYAPPGYYMLDILNSKGVPAVMPFVLLAPSNSKQE
jgi:hypothetical protein